MTLLMYRKKVLLSYFFIKKIDIVYDGFFFVF